jgi:hypothetical protein
MKSQAIGDFLQISLDERNDGHEERHCFRLSSIAKASYAIEPKRVTGVTLAPPLHVVEIVQESGQALKIATARREWAEEIVDLVIGAKASASKRRGESA